MPGLRGSVGAKVGVMSAVEVQTPLASTGSNNANLADINSAATWALFLFLAAIVVLYFIL